MVCSQFYAPATLPNHIHMHLMNRNFLAMLYCLEPRLFVLFSLHFEQCSLTDRLAFFTHSVYMRPSFQGLLWDEFDGLSEDKLKILFLMG